MTREEVHNLYRKKAEDPNFHLSERLFEEIIDAVIDCAKEETIERLRNLGWFDNV